MVDRLVQRKKESDGVGGFGGKRIRSLSVFLLCEIVLLRLSLVLEIGTK